MINERLFQTLKHNEWDEAETYGRKKKSFNCQYTHRKE